MPDWIYASLLYLSTALQFSLGIVFLLSALPKLRRPLVFARSVVEYRVLPAKLAYAFALTVIPLEVLFAASFLTGWLLDMTYPLAAGLLLVFLAAVGINLRRGRRITCGCFGDAGEEISPRTFVRLCMLLAVLLILMVPEVLKSSLRIAPDFSGLGVMPIALLLPTVFLSTFLLLLGSWILSIPELVFLFRRSRE
jgi:hypothetical protein